MDRVGRASGAIGESSPSLPPRCQGDMRQSLSGAHPGPATHRQRPTSGDGTPRLRRRQLGFCHPQRRAGSRFLSVTPGHGAPFLSPVRSPSQQLSPLPTCLSSLFWGAASRSPAVCSLARLLLQAFRKVADGHGCHTVHLFAPAVPGPSLEIILVTFQAGADWGSACGSGAQRELSTLTVPWPASHEAHSLGLLCPPAPRPHLTLT